MKRILLAVAPVVMIFGTVSADDDLLNKFASMDSDSISAVASVEDGTALEDEDDFGQADVDALLGNDENDEDAIAACFRRIGFGYGRGFGRGYRSFGYGYGCGYNWYSGYRYRCYRPVTYSCNYYPVTYHLPVYTNYWACY